MKVRIIYLLLIVLTSCSYNAKITYVRDGDSFTLDNGKKIRLKDADTPELDQPFGLEAKRFTDSVVKGKQVIVIENGKSYERKVAEIEIEGVSLAYLLVSKGFAHINPKYCRDTLLINEYDRAKRNKVGLFAHNYTMPYKFRKHKN